MWFIAIKGLNGWKARNRCLMTKAEAYAEMVRLNKHHRGEFRIADADHYPDKQLLVDRHGFS